MTAAISVLVVVFIFVWCVLWPNDSKLSHGGKPTPEKQKQGTTAVGSGDLLGGSGDLLGVAAWFQIILIGSE